VAAKAVAARAAPKAVAARAAAVRGVYVSKTGYDDASGTREAPFATLEHAASVAVSGETIAFLDGDYDASVAPSRITIADGVDIAAEDPGNVTLSHAGGPLLGLAGTTHIDGIAFDGYAQVLQALGSGSVTISATSFTDCASGATALEVGGTASVTLSGSPSTEWGNCSSFASVYDSGTLNVDGGIVRDFTDTTSGFLLRATGSATVTTTHVQLLDGTQPALSLSGTATATLDDTTISLSVGNLVAVNDQSSIAITGSELEVQPATAPLYSCIQVSMNGTGAVSVTDTRIHGCSNAMNGSIPAVLSLVRSEIYDMTFDGLELQSGEGGVIDITDCSFHDTTNFGARLGGGYIGANMVRLSVRGTTFTTATEALRLSGDVSSTWDLGTLAEPGGNTFLADTSGLKFTSAVDFISAVGNTWHPSGQSADGNGQYSASNPGDVLEVTSGVGLNYDDNAGWTLRLAENAP